VKLEDTIGLMCSDDYRDRMKAEYIQLAIRINKLEKYMEQCEDLATGFGQNLRAQRNAMGIYRTELGRRMENDGIPVESIDSVIEEE